MIEYKIVLVAVLIGIVPAIIISWWLLREKNKELLGSRFLLITFLWGVLTAIPASLFQIINMNNPTGNYFVFFLQSLNIFQDSYFTIQVVLPLIFVAIIEELSKGVGIILSLRIFSKSRRAKNLKINPGLVVGVIVGLAFGVTENGVYFANNFSNHIGNNIASIIFLRFILSTSAHIIYSGLFGAFLVDAIVNKKFLYKIFELILAFIIPVAIHTAFNVLVVTEFGILSIPLILLGFILLAFKAFWPIRKNK